MKNKIATLYTTTSIRLVTVIAVAAPIAALGGGYRSGG